MPDSDLEAWIDYCRMLGLPPDVRDYFVWLASWGDNNLYRINGKWIVFLSRTHTRYDAFEIILRQREQVDQRTWHETAVA